MDGNELAHKKLPFPIDEDVNPEVVYSNKVPKDKMLEGWDSGSPAYYSEEDKKIYILTKKPKRLVLEHEKAHAQIPNVKVGKSDDSQARGMLEDEIKAFLLTYQRIGQPKSFYSKFSDLQHQLSKEYTTQDNPWKYNFCQIMLKERDVYDDVVKKYWAYFPKQWKDDWNKFRKVTWPEHYIREMKGYPPADFAVVIDNNGKQGIMMVPRRVDKVKADDGSIGYKVVDTNKQLLDDVQYTLGKNWGVLRAINFDKQYKGKKKKGVHVIGRFKTIN